MLNPLAVGVMALGGSLLLLGALWAVRRSQAQGIVIAICGAILAASPFLISLFLSG